MDQPRRQTRTRRAQSRTGEILPNRKPRQGPRRSPIRRMTKTLAIIADFNASKSHLATNEAIAHSTASLGLAVEPRWIDTSQLAQPQALKQLREFAGIWIGPGSPYANMEGALSAIRIARE